MSYTLPEGIKEHAQELCGNSNLEVLDPGTMLKTDDDRLLVAVRDRVTQMGLWIEVLIPGKEARSFRALAQTKAGRVAIIIRGHKGGRFTDPGTFAIEDGLQYNGLVAYNADGIRELFASGELKLLRGQIP